MRVFVQHLSPSFSLRHFLLVFFNEVSEALSSDDVEQPADIGLSKM